MFCSRRMRRRSVGRPASVSGPQSLLAAVVKFSRSERSARCRRSHAVWSCRAICQSEFLTLLRCSSTTDQPEGEKGKKDPSLVLVKALSLAKDEEERG